MNVGWETIMDNVVVKHTLAVVLAVSFLVGIAWAYLEKWSVITKIFSNPTFDLLRVS